MATGSEGELRNCVFKLRDNPQRRKDTVCIGCGAGFAGDRPQAALKLLQRVKELDYLVLECLAERTLADRFQIMLDGGKGYDPRISEWMSQLLPLAVERGVCIITNMGAIDPLGAQQEVLDVASSLGLDVTVAAAYEVSPPKSDSLYLLHCVEGTKLFQESDLCGGESTYLGAAPIVECLASNPSVVIASRVADAALFLAPMDSGWKAWGEISYGGDECLRRAEAAEFLVRSWMDEVCPGVTNSVVSYTIGHDSLKMDTGNDPVYMKQISDIRLRMDGVFRRKEHALKFIEEFIALYTNGPAGGGGISTGHKREINLRKILVERENVFWRTEVRNTNTVQTHSQDGYVDRCQSNIMNEKPNRSTFSICKDDAYLKPKKASLAAPSGVSIPLYQVAHSRAGDKGNDVNFSIIPHFPGDIERLKMVITPDWVKHTVSPLLDATSFPDAEAIKQRYHLLEQVKVEIYEVPGINSLNVVVRNILDGGVNCSRRIDRHGKTISDLILCQKIALPP